MPWQVTEARKALSGADYPMSGAQLAELAKRDQADEGLVEGLRSIDRDVDGSDGVMKELKGDLGGRTPGPDSPAGLRADRATERRHVDRPSAGHGRCGERGPRI